MATTDFHNRVHTAPMPPEAVKGIAEPVATYAVRGYGLVPEASTTATSSISARQQRSAS